MADWVDGARPRTLPAALAPVLAGTGAAAHAGSADLGRAVLAAGVALALQVGVNFANDYSDGVRGTDAARVGPRRLTASGAVPPARVRLAAFGAFGVAGGLGMLLCALAGTWWLLAVGALCVVAGWFYTGGRTPYGYRGLGEVAVLVFFGWVATIGTAYTQALAVTAPAVLAGTALGLVACALLMVNNIRDIATDTVAGKRTLAVRLGDRRARTAYGALVVGGALLALVTALVAGAGPGALPLLVPVVLAALLARRVRQATAPGQLIAVLRDTGLLQLVLGVLLLLVLAL